MNPEQLLALLGWIPQEEWQRRSVSDLVRVLSARADAVETRRWFRQPRTSLGRRTPLEALRLAKGPDDPLLDELQRLALQQGV
ncbi:MAG: hypothetical protein ABR521_01075 [Gaiellaceae bacterium]